MLHKLGRGNENLVLTVNRFWAYNQVPTGTPIHNVGLEAIAFNIKMLCEAFLNGSIIHSSRYTQLIFCDVVGTTFKSNVNHFRHLLKALRQSWVKRFDAFALI
jgi:hypothetical protein